MIVRECSRYSNKYTEEKLTSRIRFPTTFRPKKDLQNKINEALKTKEEKVKGHLTFQNLIDQSIDLIYDTDPEHPFYYTEFKFDKGTNVTINFSSLEFRGDMARLPDDKYAIERILIESKIKEPLQAIQDTFIENPFNYINMPFQHDNYKIEPMKIHKKDNPRIFKGGLYIGHLDFNFKEDGDYYVVDNGEFGLVNDEIKEEYLNVPLAKKFNWTKQVKETRACFLSIYQALPFTEKEREALKNLQHMDISYRFPRSWETPDDENCKHHFNLDIRKEGDEYKFFMVIDDTFLDGLDRDVIFPAEKFFEHEAKTKKYLGFEDIELSRPKVTRGNKT
ncbi:MAG: hypothetical protein KKA79_10545 [Nanoarchaeota archaeon]|nr:hypothetical protein [Nanoarchaeota archaeon]MCG2717847.1 hypothetical protein [Nanoarchaeota archaeon]